jgi:hypothetical protein
LVPLAFPGTGYHFPATTGHSPNNIPDPEVTK